MVKLAILAVVIGAVLYITQRTGYKVQKDSPQVLFQMGLIGLIVGLCMSSIISNLWFGNTINVWVILNYILIQITYIQLGGTLKNRQKGVS